MNNDAVGSDMNFAISGTHFVIFITILLFMLNSEVDMLISRSKHSPFREQNLWFHQLWDAVQVLKRPQNITLPQPCLTGGVLFGL